MFTECSLLQGVDRRALMNTGEEGLTEEEASYRLEKFGKNELVEKKVDKWKNLYMEFTRPMALMV
jgi:H+-transporting ATPase